MCVGRTHNDQANRCFPEIRFGAKYITQFEFSSLQLVADGLKKEETLDID